MKKGKFIMWPVCNRGFVSIITFVLALEVFCATAPSEASLRKVNIADTMPEFSLQGAEGSAAYAYKHGGGKVLVLAFLPAVGERLERSIADVETLAKSFSQQAKLIDFACVISGPVEKDNLKSIKPGSELGFPILLDGEYHLWGTLGVIAAPTFLVVGKDDKILWIKAGYGYDFVPVARVHVNQALGIAQETTAEEAQHVKALTNDTVPDRLLRHLQMAKVLEQKGRLESAAAEIQKAAELDPNSIEPGLELGELYCRAGRTAAALELAEKLKPTTRTDKARVLLISGWARRQLGELEAAQKLLLETTTLDPKSVRAWFELGKVYQAKGQLDKAAESYRKALAVVFAESQEAKATETEEVRTTETKTAN